MTNRRLYLMLQALFCVVLVTWLSLAAIDVWREGSARKAEHPIESVYTPEIVSEKTATVAPLCFMGLGLLVAGLVLGVKDERTDAPVKDAALGRDLLVSRVAKPSEAMLAERRKQKRLLWIGRGAFALCMVPILIYLLNPAHFPEADTEGMFYALLRVLLPWTAAGLCALAVTSMLRRKSVFREIRAAQAQLKAEKAAGIAAAPRSVDTPKKLRFMSYMPVWPYPARFRLDSSQRPPVMVMFSSRFSREMGAWVPSSVCSFRSIRTRTPSIRRMTAPSSASMRRFEGMVTLPSIR